MSCTDKIEATLPPSPSPTPQPVNAVPMPLRNLFLARCASCHGNQGEGATAKSIYQAHSRSPKNWAAFLKNPQSIDKKTKKQPVEGLTETEYAAFGEWLAKITKENRLGKVSK